MKDYISRSLFRYLLCVIIFGISLFMCVQKVSAQLQDNTLSNTDSDKEYIYLDPLVFYDFENKKHRVDIYIQIPMTNLQFLKNQSSSNFESNIDFSIVIKNSKNETVINNDYSEIISNTKEEQKNIEQINEYIIKDFFLSPGKYKIYFILRDKNNNREYSKEASIEFTDYSKEEIAFSDIMIVSDFKENENGRKVITPLVNNNVGNLKDFYLFYEVYNMKSYPIYITYKYDVIDNRQKKIINSGFIYYLQPGVNKKIEKLPAKDFESGNYKLEIYNKDNNEIVQTKSFYFRWNELPASIKDLDLAISQLKYIATSEEFEYLKSAKTNAEKEKRFVKFWKKKDPSPNTPKNELMIEYYARIRIANQRYSHYTEGWKTDMGMVFIIYGEPSSIERVPFGDYTKPYEVWDYYNINKRFVFVDNTGFGDYRLTTPIWDDRNQLRY